MFTIIAALDDASGIGKAGKIPWRSPADMQWFKSETMGSALLIMGRKTWESIGSRPLKGRNAVVLSRNGLTLETFAKSFVSSPHAPRAYIIGGGEIYREALRLGIVDSMLLSRIPGCYGCDVFFPEFDSGEWNVADVFEAQAGSGVDVTFLRKRVALGSEV